MKINSYNKGPWKDFEDQIVKKAINAYQKTVPFPQHPFDHDTNVHAFFNLKQRYLKNFSRSTKQIRERWLNCLCPQLKSSTILENDEPLIYDLYQQHKYDQNKWVSIAQKIYLFFDCKYYYSPNTIKNFFNCKKRKDQKKFNLKTAVQDAKAMQDFDSESLLTGAEHSQKVKAAPIKSDYGSKDCVDLTSSTAVFRFNDQNKILFSDMDTDSSLSSAPIFDKNKKTKPNSDEVEAKPAYNNFLNLETAIQDVIFHENITICDKEEKNLMNEFF